MNSSPGTLPLKAAVPNVLEYTVSEISAALKRTVEDAFGYVRVRGEISGYRGPHSSGHAYFSLKDERARLEAVRLEDDVRQAPLQARGRASRSSPPGGSPPSPAQSKYQIVIDALEPAGVGALMALLEERRRKLAAEGLFAEARKKPLPYLPRVIGVVTSPTGAVIRDILHRLADRFPVRVVALAGARAGRDRGRGGRRGDRRLQPARGRWADPAARRHHRRTRRRQPRGPVELQRGGRRARRRGLARSRSSRRSATRPTGR